MRLRAFATASLIGAAAAIGPTATAGPAQAACVPTALPITTLSQMAAGRPVGGKKVGAGWEVVILGTVTEVRHKSPKFRYRITMHVDSALGGELPALYTFFGSSSGTYPFEVGKAYAVPLARRVGRGPLLPTTELWANLCDPVMPVTDLAAAHDIIARTKPGYVPTPTPTPSPTPVAEEPTPTPTPTVTPSPTSDVAVTAVRRNNNEITFPGGPTLGEAVRRAVLVVVGLALLIAIIAALESWWSRRHFA